MVADILIVEDDRDVRESLADLLRSEGYSVEEAQNGQEALDRLQAAAREVEASHPPSPLPPPPGKLPRLILLDLIMPRMSGAELKARLARIPLLSRIPVWLLSGLGDLEPRAGVLSAAGFLRKPIDVGFLLDLVKRYVRPPFDPAHAPGT